MSDKEKLEEALSLLDDVLNVFDELDSVTLTGEFTYSSYNDLREEILTFIRENEWVCTDPSCNQYRKDISDSIFAFEEDRIANPETKETVKYEAIINIQDYTWDEIVSACESFGYNAKQVDKWLTEGEELALIAECLFELET